MKTPVHFRRAFFKFRPQFFSSDLEYSPSLVSRKAKMPGNSEADHYEELIGGFNPSLFRFVVYFFPVTRILLFSPSKPGQFCHNNRTTL
jgi:hypothetical protein